MEKILKGSWGGRDVDMKAWSEGKEGKKKRN
jgi:hypothetical protein